MIGRLNHVAIAVPDLDAAARFYAETLGAEVGARIDLAEHGVSVRFVDLPNTRIELIHPFGAGSPISRFLERNPNGGMHHLCYEVPDIEAAAHRLAAQGLTLLGDGRARIGAHGNPVLFLAPRDANGVLTELEEVRPTGG